MWTIYQQENNQGIRWTHISYFGLAHIFWNMHTPNPQKHKKNPLFGLLPWTNLTIKKKNLNLLSHKIQLNQ